jgi:hypothetical protein
MTSEEFRADQSLVAWWAGELKNNKMLQIVLEVMEHEHPCNYTVLPDKNDDISPTRAAIELGLTRGYSKALGKIYLLGVAKKRSQDPGPGTYDTPPTPTHQ